MRVFIGPSEIAGYFAALERGLRAHGVEVIFADLDRSHPHQYVVANHPLARIAHRIEDAAMVSRQSAPRLARLLLALYAGSRIALFLWAAIRCDAFIYSFGSTLTWYPEIELRLLRWLRRRILFVFVGSDSRPPYFEPWLITDDTGWTIADCIRETAARKRSVWLAERYAHLNIDNPFQAQFHERPYVNWAAIGTPFASPPVEETKAPNRADGRVRVLHAPSAPEVKGTAAIRQAIGSLQASGYPIDYVELTGRPHSEVMAELRRCDLVIDKLYSNSPMAGLATEAAAYGRPTVVGGHTGPFHDQVFRENWMPPVAFCDPGDFEATVERLITDAGYRRDLGRRAREYVVRERSPEVVAARYLRLLRDDVPKEWWFEPGTLEYVNGLGEESAVRGLVRQVVRAAGPGALLLDHAPRIRDALLRFAGLDGRMAGPPRRTPNPPGDASPPPPG